MFLNKKDNPTAFKIINALSFHSNPTHSQPETPIIDNIKSINCIPSIPLIDIAQTIIKLDIHLIYQAESFLSLFINVTKSYVVLSAS